MTEPTRTPPAAPDADEPVSDRYRSYTPSEPAEIRRKLLFGVALILALLSVYAGLLGWGSVLQYGFGSLAAATVLIALITGATGPPQRASSETPPSPSSETPTPPASDAPPASDTGGRPGPPA